MRRPARTSMRSPTRRAASPANGPAPSARVSTWPASTVAPDWSRGRDPKRYQPTVDALVGQRHRATVVHAAREHGHP